MKTDLSYLNANTMTVFNFLSGHFLHAFGLVFAFHSSKLGQRKHKCMVKISRLPCWDAGCSDGYEYLTVLTLALFAFN